MVTNNKILIVDDEEDLLEMYTDLIEHEGIGVDTCASGSVALEKLKENTYELVISDKNMFEISGLDLLDYVHSNLPSIPFFLVTGDRMPNLCFQHSKSQVVNKPLDIFALIELVKKSI